jgi:hypothetical protein
MDFLLLATLITILFLFGAIVGHAVGYEKGRDEGRRR